MEEMSVVATVPVQKSVLARERTVITSLEMRTSAGSFIRFIPPAVPAFAGERSCEKLRCDGVASRTADTVTSGLCEEGTTRGSEHGTSFKTKPGRILTCARHRDRDLGHRAEKCRPVAGLQQPRFCGSCVFPNFAWGGTS